MGHTGRLATPLRLGAWLVVAEALGLLLFVLGEAVAGAGGHLAPALGTAAFLILYAVAQVFAARALLRLDRRARAPLVLTQLIQLGLGWGLRDSAPIVATALVGVAVGVLCCVLGPSATRLLERADDAP